MERPFVICHMVSSVDGKIDGSWFEAPEVGIPLKESGMIRNAYHCSTTLYGAATMAETYAEGFVKNLRHADIALSREDYIAHSEVDSYFVAIDPQGSIAYADKYIEKRGRPKVHVIEVLLENVSDDYLVYLRSLDISYIFAGADSLDAALCMEKLHRLFGINKLMICGGGIVDYTFLQAGLIDELSLVIVPPNRRCYRCGNRLRPLSLCTNHTGNFLQTTGSQNAAWRRCLAALSTQEYNLKEKGDHYYA